MIVKLRALILAFLLSLLSIPAAMAVGGPCLDYFNCERPEDTFRPPPFRDPFPHPMQQEEPPPEEPPEEEEEEEECNGAAGSALAGVIGLAGASMGFPAGVPFVALSGALLHASAQCDG